MCVYIIDRKILAFLKNNPAFSSFLRNWQTNNLDTNSYVCLLKSLAEVIDEDLIINTEMLSALLAEYQSNPAGCNQKAKSCLEKHFSDKQSKFHALTMRFAQALAKFSAFGARFNLSKEQVIDHLDNYVYFVLYIIWRQLKNELQP